MKDLKADLFHISNVPFWAAKSIVFVVLTAVFYGLIASDPANNLTFSIVLALIGGYVVTALVFVVGNCILQVAQLQLKRSKLARQKLKSYTEAPKWYQPSQKHSRLDAIR